MKASRTIWVCMALVGIAGVGYAKEESAPRLAFNIHAQPLEQALTEFGATSGLQVLFDSKLAARVEAPEVVGALGVEEALKMLLEGTTLRYEFINSRTVAIRGASDQLGSRVRDEESEMRMAQGEDASAVYGAPDSGQSAQASEDAKLDEIVVTAQKRIERLQDVPVPVTAIGGEALVASNQLRIEDFYSKVPGLNYVSASDRSLPGVSIRGITTGAGQTPTVGFVLDEVPYGGSIGVNGVFLPHIDPSDLARVEVLRGPQGTLYGASSMGGLIKYVTVDPSTDAMSGRLEAGALMVEEGDQLGYNLRGGINVPINSNFAVRASGYSGRDPGYIDNVGYIGNARGIRRDVNQTDREGGRLSALWVPAESFSLKLNALLQHSEKMGSDLASLEAGLGELQQRRLIGDDGYDQKAQAYGATLNARLGRFNLTSATGYSIKESDSDLDFSALTGLAQLFFPQASGVAYPADLTTRKLTQEIRLVAKIGEKTEWLFGGFYTQERTLSVENVNAVDSADGAVIGNVANIKSSIPYEEYAAFTNLTFQLTNRLDLQLGLRASENKQDRRDTTVGPLFGPSAVPSVSMQPSDGHAVTYLVTPRFKVSPDLMMYARVASGYRPGGPNLGGCVGLFPCDYKADKTQNYEIGIKGDAFARALSFDASLYYIDWKDIQLSLVNQFSYTANGGSAKSQGVEVSIESRPLTGMTLSAWLAYNDPELTQDPPVGTFNSAANVGAGDRLPYSSRMSGSLSLDQELPLTSLVSGFVGASVSYVDNRKGSFPGFFSAATQRETLPAYVQTDVRGGIRYDSWTINLFINNLTDERGVLSRGLEKSDPNLYNFIQPRTAGISLVKTFK